MTALFLMSCEKTTKPEDTPDVVDSNTIVLSDDTANACTGWGDGGFNMSIPIAAETQNLAVGNVIVSKPTAAFPNGFLRRVTQIAKDRDAYTVVTQTASLDQALKSGYVAFNQSLSPSQLLSTQATIPGVKLLPSDRGLFNFVIDTVLYDADGNPATGNDQVHFSGTADIDLSVAGNVWIQNNALKQLRFTANQEITLNANVSNSMSFFGVDHDVTIFSQMFQPFIVYFGVFPVVITPKLEVSLNLTGNATVTVTAGYQYTNNVTAGIEYTNNTWKPVKTITESATSNMTDPLAYNISYRAALQPGVSMLLYGVMGPQISVGTYGEIIVNPAEANWWQLWGGFFGEVSINSTLFSDDDIKAGPWELFNTRFLIKQANNPIQGVIKGMVRDAVTQSGLAGVAVKVYKNNNMQTSVDTQANGQFSLNVTAGTGYRVTFTKTGYHPVTYNNVNAPGNQETTLETILQIDETYVGTGYISGYVTNALTGSPVSDVQLTFRPGLNTQSGSATGTTTTDSYGAYSYSLLTTGNYTVQATKTDFVTTYFNVVVIGGQTTANQNGVITPVLDASEVRVVLTWGASPTDLDSHITGPNPDGGRFHVYYGNSSFWYNDTQYCNLDLDDVTSFGPETITIYNQTGGLYRYSVHDYSNRYSTTSYALSNSGATVRVYFGSNLVQTFYVPSNQIGTLWTVFELFDNQIIPKNLMTNESNPGNITKGKQTDAALMINLPEK